MYGDGKNCQNMKCPLFHTHCFQKYSKTQKIKFEVGFSYKDCI